MIHLNLNIGLFQNKLCLWPGHHFSDMSLDWILVATTKSDNCDAVMWKKFTSYKCNRVFFTQVANIYADLLEHKKAFTKEKSSTPTGLVWDTNVAAVSLFWDTNMAAMTSCENTQH